MREADAGGIVLTTGVRLGAGTHATSAQTHAAETVQSRLLGCVGESERLEAALQVLLEASGAEVGYLYGLTRGSLRSIAQIPQETEPPSGVLDWLESCLRGELQAEVSTQIDAGIHEPDTARERFTDAAGREFEAVPLCGKRVGKPVIAGFAAIHCKSPRRPGPQRSVVEAVTEVLIDDGIVEPVEQ